MSTSRQAHRSGTLALSIALTAIGVVMVVLTLARGGGPLALGVVLGALFAAVGAGRLYITLRA